MVPCGPPSPDHGEAGARPPGRHLTLPHARVDTLAGADKYPISYKYLSGGSLRQLPWITTRCPAGRHCASRGSPARTHTVTSSSSSGAKLPFLRPQSSIRTVAAEDPSRMKGGAVRMDEAIPPTGYYRHCERSGGRRGWVKQSPAEDEKRQYITYPFPIWRLLRPSRFISLRSPRPHQGSQ
jgi:hypothetical protein